jgi:hypothetical protein
MQLATSHKKLLTLKQVNNVLAEHVSALDTAKHLVFDPNKSHSPTESIDSVVIPLGSEPEIRLHYINNVNITRFGKILEDLDTFAGKVNGCN